MQNYKILFNYLFKSYLSLKMHVVNVSCSSTACDWTKGRNRSHSNSNQLTHKWGVGSCIIFMATDNVTEHVVYKRHGMVCCICTKTNYSTSVLAKTPISHRQHVLASITESALQIKLTLNSKLKAKLKALTPIHCTVRWQ